MNAYVLDVQSKVLMAPLHVRSKVCIAHVYVRRKVLKFALHMDGRNADFAPHMEQRHSFRDQIIAKTASLVNFPRKCLKLPISEEFI